MTVQNLRKTYRFNHGVAPSLLPRTGGYEKGLYMIRSMESLYQMRYYRKKTMDSLRKTIKKLKEEKKIFMDSPEGQQYKKRLSSSYQKEYRNKNKESIRKYQKEYAEI